MTPEERFKEWAATPKGKAKMRELIGDYGGDRAFVEGCYRAHCIWIRQKGHLKKIQQRRAWGRSITSWCQTEAANAVQSGYRITQGVAMTAEEECQRESQKWRKTVGKKEPKIIGEVLKEVLDAKP